ncbi:hypothetical protein [Pseudotamlana carrageenivorans]|uniref:DUF3164 domain-containing protein n=1 Tax=Pseudotamlana carrageenivorans TaxID=2069432 RepID=A0A2I7SF66_9FLAO|nr:hypothetical protein [Tamlana carrageenivorans]AUS04514.1 hypothetical protein C1A40_03060 [Tamlana carrageenivorans]
MSTLDLSTLSASDKEALMQQLANEAKAKKEKIKNDRKAYKELSCEFVTRNIDKLVHHNDITEILIETLFKDFEPIKAIKEQVYGNDPQDSHTSTLNDGSASITIGHNVTIKFDGTEAAGVSKIKEFIKSLSDGNNNENTIKLAKAVDTFLKINPKTGMLNPSKIIELSKLRDEFNDERFDDGLDIIFNAQIRTQNSMYVSGWKFIQHQGLSKKLTFRFSV